jgi:hypothetical protein
MGKAALENWKGDGFFPDENIKLSRIRVFSVKPD